MNIRIITAILLAVAACAACSEPERNGDSAPAAGTTRVALQRQGSDAVSVHAFRRQGAEFLYDTLFRDGWTPDGTLRVRLANGDWKFLFASGAGANTVLDPQPLRGATWDATAFMLREASGAAGTYLPADELFLQDDPAAADSVYTFDGTDATVRARLTRAVCRISVTVKRGYRVGDAYEPVPYEKPHSVCDEIDRIELTALGTGLRVTPYGTAGAATVRATLHAAAEGTLDNDGFVSLEGPFVLPAADGVPIGLELTVVPAAGSGIESTPLTLTGMAERNKRLEVTLWITSGYPTIGVEIDTAPIDREQEGDSGIWE